jgi:hypothetical protein
MDRKYHLGDNAPVRINDDIAEDLIELTERVKARRQRPSPLQGLAALAGGVPPETMMLALAYYLSDHPGEFFSKEAWGSKAAQEKRDWLRDNDLIDANDEPTGKLSVWLKEVLATPLPVQRWEVER